MENHHWSQIFEETRIQISLSGTMEEVQNLHPTACSSPADVCTYEGMVRGITVTMVTKQIDPHMSTCRISVRSNEKISCDKIKLSMVLRAPGKKLESCYVPGGCHQCGIAGLHRLSEWPVTPEDIRFCGLFAGSTEPCLLLATQIPSNMELLYQAALLEQDCVQFTATNYVTSSSAGQRELETETILVLTGLRPAAALQRYAQTIPALPQEKFAEPLVGWSTWDYYYTDISPADLEENMKAIRADAVLSSKIRCIFVDDGWQYREGEWYANYRFPGGTAELARQIRAMGFEPGIWTNGCQVWPLTHMGLRHGEMLLKDENGNAITFENRYIIDPTHPEGAQYLFQTYRRLYEDGFRLFKVDFVSTIEKGKRFYRPEVGPFGAIRTLFSIVRRAVGPESIILGCSYPPDCGAGYVDTCRFAVDIHNHWSHVLWILEYMQMSFWQSGRLYRLDPDFLVVRGRDTSEEQNMNVFQPMPNPQQEADGVESRWRRGPVFSGREAETWANLVVFCGGNVILGDRISRLNQKGKALLYSHLQPNRAAAVPLDLGEGPHASLWYSAADRKLLVINLAEERTVRRVSLEPYGLVLPETVTGDKTFEYQNGTLSVALENHESAVFEW